jgi:S-adenosylmethionine synthetase
MDLVVRTGSRGSPGTLPLEVVERKGLGHPDTICDAIAEHVCVRLCRLYQERFGAILHHNVDKALLRGGSARPAFGGGEVLEPIELYVAGRATEEFRGERIAVQEVAVEACRDWLGRHMPQLVGERGVKVIPLLRPGSSDLARLFARGTATPLANDTSCGAGFAPLSDLERVVLEVERTLNLDETKRRHPEIGHDVKVMGVRRGSRIRLTVGCAFVGRFVADIDDYVSKRETVARLVLEAARKVTSLEVQAAVNVADDLDHGDIFLTVTGTSAEAGDDGEVGRGNRTNGLITPYRPMTIEAAAGKNPVSHVGKLFNLAAGRIAAAIVARMAGARDASCVLVSEIGRPIDDPALADVELGPGWEVAGQDREPSVRAIVIEELARVGEVREALLDGRAGVY